MFLHHILTRDNNALIKKFFLAQERNPTRGDWAIIVKKDLEEFGMNMTNEEIAACPKTSFKIKVKEACAKIAFQKLMQLKSQHSKGRELEYNKLQMSGYLKNPKITLFESKMIFKIRSRSLLFKSNYKTRYEHEEDCTTNTRLLCPICECHEDTQEEMMTCSALTLVNIDSFNYSYMDIFGQDQDRLISSSRAFIKKYQKRELLIESLVK